MYLYKKFLSFFSILFLYSIISLATELPEDVASGNKYEKSLTGSYYKDYGMKVVSKEGNHPVRAGEKSIRFEVRKEIVVRINFLALGMTVKITDIDMS